MEDSGKMSTLFRKLWMRQFAKASWQKHGKLLPFLVKSQKVNFWWFGCFVVVFLLLLLLCGGGFFGWFFFSGRWQHLMLSYTYGLGTRVPS